MPKKLARKWSIGLQAAKDTLAATTQYGIRTAVHPLTQRVRVDHLDIHRPRLRGMWFADTMLSRIKSKRGNTCANVFTDGKFTRAIPMSGRADAGKSLADFADDIGVPENLTTDGAGEFTGKHKEFVREARRLWEARHVRTRLFTTEQG